MTAYTEHADALFDPGKPILGSVASETRDNLKSVAEGDVTAPRIRTVAIQAPAAGTAHTILRLVDGNESTSVTSYSGTLRTRGDDPSSVGFTALVAGVITIQAQHSATTPATSTLRLLKNGAVLSTFTTLSTSMVARSVDVTVAVGDAIILQQVTSSGSFPTAWSTIKVLSNNPDFAVC